MRRCTHAQACNITKHCRVFCSCPRLTFAYCTSSRDIEELFLLQKSTDNRDQNICAKDACLWSRLRSFQSKPITNSSSWRSYLIMVRRLHKILLTNISRRVHTHHHCTPIAIGGADFSEGRLWSSHSAYVAATTRSRSVATRAQEMCAFLCLSLITL